LKTISIDPPVKKKNKHPQIREKSSSIKFHENPSSGTSRWRDRRMDGQI